MAYATQYIVADLLGVIDERKSLRALRVHFDVRDAKAGKLADFLTEAIRCPEWEFEDRLALYNQEQLHASHVEFLAEHGAPTPLAFKEKYGAAFVQHFVDNVSLHDVDPKEFAASLLEFSERRPGHDWRNLHGHDVYGVDILDYMHAAVEEALQDQADEAEEKALEERKRPVTFTASAEDLWAIAQLQMGNIEITLSQAQLKRLRAT
jgi:hypothetical protein